MTAAKQPIYLSAEPAQRGIVPGLDGLRALSIMIVLVGHFMMGPEAVGFSALGVYIFFVVSGFLVTRLFFVEARSSGTVDIPFFYFRRFLRLYPVLIAYMGFVTLISLIYSMPTPLNEYLATFFYYVNYLRAYQEFHGLPDNILPIGPLWSLSVEEHFYFLMPCIIFLTHCRPRAILAFAIAALILPLAIRTGYILVWPQLLHSNVIYCLSETRFDSIAAGVLLASLCEISAGRRFILTAAGRTPLVVGILLLFFSYAFRNALFQETLRYTVRNTFSFLLVCHVVFNNDGNLLQRILNKRYVEWVGKISYSLYIWHGCLLWLGNIFHIKHGFITGALAIFGAFVLATTSYYLVEQPFLRLKKLWRPKVTLATNL